MVTNIWKNIGFYCMNHPEPIPFYVYEGSATPFYACKKYMRKDEMHPEGHEDNEDACGNRLSFNMAISIVEKISKEIEDSLSKGELTDYNGFTFRYKNVRVKVLKYTPQKGVTGIGILNENEIGNWR